MDKIKRGNLKLIQLEDKIKILDEKEKEKIQLKLKKLIEKYPIHRYIGMKDFEKIIKNIYDNRENEYIVTQIEFNNKELHKKKKNEEKDIEKIEEIIDEDKEIMEMLKEDEKNGEHK